jgi:hypothetical protein
VALKKLPSFTQAGFDLTTHNFADGNDTTGPRRQGRCDIFSPGAGWTYFSWNHIPKRWKIYQSTTKWPNDHKINQMAIIYSKLAWNIHIPTFSNLRPSKIYPKWDFGFGNIPSGNRGRERDTLGVKLAAVLPVRLEVIDERVEEDPERVGDPVQDLGPIFKIFSPKVSEKKLAFFDSKQTNICNLHNIHTWNFFTDIFWQDKFLLSFWVDCKVE